MTGIIMTNIGVLTKSGVYLILGGLIGWWLISTGRLR
jgi:hypothetical protein